MTWEVFNPIEARRQAAREWVRGEELHRVHPNRERGLHIEPGRETPEDVRVEELSEIERLMSLPPVPLSHIGYAHEQNAKSVLKAERKV